MKLILLILLLPVFVFSQAPDPLLTAFPSLRIPVSSRGLGMGDLGIASATENQQLYYNVAKTAFTQNFHQASVSYMPWLSGINDDTRFMNANYLADISNSSAMGIAINYLSLGNIAIRDDNGATLSNYHGSEYNLAGSYGLQVAAKASLGVAFRMIGQHIYSTAIKNAIGVSGDLSYYQFAELGSVTKKIEWGVVLSNLGPKMNDASLPANVGVGIGYSNTDQNSGDSYSFALDANRLIKEDWRAVRMSIGGEYGFNNEIFFRGGVSYESVLTGNRKFIGLGVGYKGLVSDQSIGLDFHYLVPFGIVTGVSPFQNAFGFTLKLSFGNFQ
ncbi:MAG: PorV/PorQ family protein [Bacteroidota bacterium]